MSNTEKLFIAEAALRRAAEAYADWAHADTHVNTKELRRSRLNESRAALRAAANEFAAVSNAVVRKERP